MKNVLGLLRITQYYVVARMTESLGAVGVGIDKLPASPEIEILAEISSILGADEIQMSKYFIHILKMWIYCRIILDIDDLNVVLSSANTQESQHKSHLKELENILDDQSIHLHAVKEYKLLMLVEYDLVELLGGWTRRRENGVIYVEAWKRDWKC